MLKDLLIFIKKNFVLKSMKINVFADTICGWCFIGHTNLNNALKKFSNIKFDIRHIPCLLYTSPSPRDRTRSRMPSSA